MSGDVQSSSQDSWFKKSIVYQIYPLSFQDSDNDGIGDLKGITGRLSYLVDLGINAVWICPFYPSPMADHGYDITDYTNVDPRFGTLADFDILLHEAHKLGIKVMADFVLNHTSNEHPWFISSRSSRNSPYRDWYVWRDPRHDGPPNNWRSVPGDSAWTYDETTQQYYLHQFMPNQPDLNWRNPEVVKAMTDAMRFWFARGLDGFRIDAISHLLEDKKFRDDKLKKEFINKLDSSPMRRFTFENLTHNHTMDNPTLTTVIKQFNDIAAEYPDKFIICETYSPIAVTAPMYIHAGPHIAPFNFSLTGLQCTPDSIRWAVEQYSETLFNVQTAVLGNHDLQRIASRWPRAAVPLAAMLQLTVGGTPFIYYGDEIGMESLKVGMVVPNNALSKPIPTIDGFNASLDDTGKGWFRHQSRLPMQWSVKKEEGFTTGSPWVSAEQEIDEQQTVSYQQRDPQSLLNFYKTLISLRKEYGLETIRPIHISNGHAHCISYDLVRDDALVATVMLNPTDTQVTIPTDVYLREQAQHGPYTIISTHQRIPQTSTQFPIEKSHMLEAYEGVILFYRNRLAR